MKKQVITIIMLMILSVSFVYAESKLVMGVYLNDMWQKDYDELGIKGNYGVKIDVIVKDGPADVAGLKADDVILEIDGEKVRSTDQVSKMYFQKKKGQNIKIEVWRDGTTKNFDLTLIEREYHPKPYLGVYLADLSLEKYEEYNVKEKRGILIKKVVDGSPASDAGLQAKDVLITFAGEKVYSDNQLSLLLKEFRIDDKVKLEVIRDGKLEKLKIKLGDRKDRKKIKKIKT